MKETCHFFCAGRGKQLFGRPQVIKGWTEAMQLMVEGDKWEMYIPSELGYGDSGSPPKIKGGDPLIFQMEILKIKGGKKPASKCVACFHCFWNDGFGE